MKKERSRLCIQGAEAVCGRWGEAEVFSRRKDHFHERVQ